MDNKKIGLVRVDVEATFGIIKPGWKLFRTIAVTVLVNAKLEIVSVDNKKLK